jgi:tetratricopeptide (TPR) repeat protein
MSTPEDTRPELRVLVQQAHALIDRRRFAQARQLLTGAIQHYPEHAELLYLCAFLDYSEKKLAAADETVNRVLVNAPQHYGARNLRAELYEAQKRYPEAEAVWIDLLRDYPESPDCYAGYADLMLRTLHLEKAGRLIAEGLRLAPNHRNCLYIGYLLEVIQGRSHSGDSQHLQQLLQEYPERSQSLLALVVDLDQRGDSRAALRVAQQLLAMRPDSEHFVNLVRALKRRNHWSLLPLYPMNRWGWGGAAAVTAIGILSVRIAAKTLSPAAAGTITLIWLGYVVYSWVWPPILRKLI